jgi:hypothetical protein
VLGYFLDLFKLSLILPFFRHFLIAIEKIKYTKKLRPRADNLMHIQVALVIRGFSIRGFDYLQSGFYILNLIFADFSLDYLWIASKSSMY